jgi:hypothetical protein
MESIAQEVVGNSYARRSEGLLAALKGRCITLATDAEEAARVSALFTDVADQTSSLVARSP